MRRVGDADTPDSDLAVDQHGDEEQHDADSDQDQRQQVLLAGPAGKRRHKIQRCRAADDRQHRRRFEMPAGCLEHVAAQYQHRDVDHREHRQEQQ